MNHRGSRIRAYSIFAIIPLLGLFIVSGVVHSDATDIGKLPNLSDAIEPIEINNRFISPRFNRAAKPALRQNFNRAAKPSSSIKPQFNRAAKPSPNIKLQFNRSARAPLNKAFSRAANPLRQKFRNAHRNPDATGRIRSFRTKRDTTFYRVYSGNPGKGGDYLTRSRPRSSNQARSSLALPHSNRATHIQKVVVPKGQWLTVSRARPNYKQPGGGIQYRLHSKRSGSTFNKGNWLRGGLTNVFTQQASRR